MSDLTEQQRDELAEAMESGWEDEPSAAELELVQAMIRNLAPVVASMIAGSVTEAMASGEVWDAAQAHIDKHLAGAEQRGADRITAAVAALANEWDHRGEYGDASLTEFARTLRAALSDPDAALSRVKAEALREAADAWDDRSERNLSRLKRMAEEHYHAGGPSMPTIWLRDRADSIARGGDDAHHQATRATVRTHIDPVSGERRGGDGRG